MKNIFASVVLLFGIYACKPTEDNSCSKTEYTTTNNADTTNLAFVDSVYIFNVLVFGNNGCANNPILLMNKVGNNFEFKATIEYKGCVCTMIAMQFAKTAPYTFTDTGTYLLKFYNNLGAVHRTDTLKVIKP